MYSSNRFFSTHKRTIFGIVFGLAFSAVVAYAAPPSGGYDPGDTLDPDCVPSTTDCIVKFPGGGSSVWGSITGTLSDQTDLQDALDDKENLLTFSTGLTRSTNTITNNLSTGVSGGQTAVGGTVSGNNLTLSSTSNASKGKILFGTSGAYDEANGRLGIGTINPGTVLDVRTSSGSVPFIIGDGVNNFLSVNAVANTVTAIGVGAGSGSSNALHSNFIGTDAGGSSTDAVVSNFIGSAAGQSSVNVYSSNVIGQESGRLSSDVSGSTFITGAGVLSSQILNSHFIGNGAGQNSTSISYSTFIGNSAGYQTTSASNSTFIGQGAGAFTQAHDSVFMGLEAGYNAVRASNSIFIGNRAGRFTTGVSPTGSDNSANSIFIGAGAGAQSGDTSLNNVSGNSSILIGINSSTGGFSNSIAIGKNATNTASNQFTIGSAYTQINARGVNYTWPSAQAAGSGYVLSNNGSGVLSWVAGGGGGGGGVTLQTNGTPNGSQSLLNLVAGSNVTLADNGSGAVTINASGGGGGGGSGTVTSVALTVPTGLSVTGSPITSSGTLAISTSLNGLVYGTGTGLAAATIGTGLDFTGGVLSSTINGITLQTDGVANGSQVLLNLVSGANVSLSDNGSGVVTINATSSSVFSSTDNLSLYSFNSVDPGSGAYSNLFGANIGNGPVSYSNIIGVGAGSTSPTDHSNFIGYMAGSNGSNTTEYSTFIGDSAGASRDYASYATFIGAGAGSGIFAADNSIFIGVNAGAGDGGLDNRIFNDPDAYSILIGNNSSTGNFSKSIALGYNATNTAPNQFMIGSTTGRIEEMVFNGGIGNTCSVNAGTGITCSSDERLKTNIQDLETNTLDKVLSLRTIRYNWTSNPNGNQMIGFIAQNLKPQFPELITTNIDGMLSVNYAQMTPILVEAIREMDLKITGIADLDISNSWRDSLVAWFASASNGISKMFAGEITTKTLCVADESGAKTCLTKGQLDTLINNSGQSFGPVVVIPEPAPETPTPTDPAPSEESTESELAEPETPAPTEEVTTPEPAPVEASETPAE